MPLFDAAIKAVTTAHAEYTSLTPNIEKTGEALRTLRENQAHVTNELNQLDRLGGIKALNQAQTELSSIETRLDELGTINEEIQEQLKKLSKIESSNPEERRQLAAKEIIYPQVLRLAKLLKELQPQLESIHNQRTHLRNVRSIFDQSVYNNMMAITRIETALKKNHLNEINNELIQIIDNSPVAKIFNKSRSYTPWEAQIDDNESQAQKHNLSTEKDLVDKEATRLDNSIKQLENTIHQNESEEERTLPETKSRLEKERRTNDKAIQRLEMRKPTHQGIIAAFDIIPQKAESLTEEDITVYREGLEHKLAVIINSINTNQAQLSELWQKSYDANTHLTKAVEALQDQYNLCAGSLVALTTCAVVALVLLEVLTLPVAAPLLLVGVAAIGLWHHTQETDPETLSNSSPTVP